MMVSSNALKAVVALGCIAAASVAAPSAAEARVFFAVGVGVPLFYPPFVYPPYYYGPPVVYPPAPVVYGGAPTAPSAAAQTWYYCDNPAGYFPSVQSCSVPWRPVQPPAK
jgi:hypothetical protein